MRQHSPYQITGCVLSGLLSACFEEIPPTLGIATAEECLRNCRKIVQMGFEAADLQCGEYVLSDGLVSEFKKRFGTASGRAAA